MNLIALLGMGVIIFIRQLVFSLLTNSLLIMVHSQKLKKLVNSPSFILASAEINNAKHAGQNTLIHIVVQSGPSRELGRRRRA